MLQKFHKNQKGFTLIELLVVIAIIGILAAVAIPQFAAYRRNAHCSRVESDVSNAMTALEAYYAQTLAYSTSLTAIGAAESPGVTLALTVTSPIKVVGTDLQAASTDCPRGNTYTITQGVAPVWAG